MGTILYIELFAFWGVVFAFLLWEIRKTDKAIEEAGEEKKTLEIVDRDISTGGETPTRAPGHPEG
ncbi:MAG: hypothetical protein AAGJ84_00300 [Pseudomonadota bacterium]